jgi:hypothetical protein
MNGVEVADSRGNPVLVGGIAASLIKREFAMTFAGKIRINDEEVLLVYLNDAWWQRHEEYHLMQETFYGSRYRPKIYLQHAVTFILGGSHGDVPMEEEANMYADGAAYRDPGTWGVLPGCFED